MGRRGPCPAARAASAVPVPTGSAFPCTRATGPPAQPGLPHLRRPSGREDRPGGGGRTEPWRGQGAAFSPWAGTPVGLGVASPPITPLQLHPSPAPTGPASALRDPGPRGFGEEALKAQSSHGGGGRSWDPPLGQWWGRRWRPGGQAPGCPSETIPGPHPPPMQAGLGAGTPHLLGPPRALSSFPLGGPSPWHLLSAVPREAACCSHMGTPPGPGRGPGPRALHGGGKRSSRSRGSEGTPAVNRASRPTRSSSARLCTATVSVGSRCPRRGASPGVRPARPSARDCT